ncbi:MAG: L-aspartate oxidase, partial [Rhizobium sp.]
VFAALRTESRGAHFRDDFPGKDATATRRRLSMAEVIDLAHALSSTSPASSSFARTA